MKGKERFARGFIFLGSYKGEMGSYGDYPFIPISPYQYPLILYYVIPSVVEGSPHSPHIVSVSF